MRKIEQQMIEAIHFDRGMTNGNTAVLHNGDAWLVSLHGHTIARGEGPRLTGINLCGWDTNTTRSRLHVLMREFGNRNRLFRHKGQTWYTTDPSMRAAEHPMPLNGWVDFTDRASWDANGAPV